MIRVQVMAVLEMAALLGERSQAVELPEGSRISDLLELLVAKRGCALQERLFQEGKELRKDVYLFLNGRHIHFLNGLDTPLKDGDVLLLMPPAGGG